ncbi:MAG TPA: hydantoinase/oxoprolinase family protein [Gaiellaceae bacterium]|nr:hydantoinase/oxoprolinase family protein [Gaiellaceae bacterium]
MSPRESYTLGIDIGGTFTDLVVVGAGGETSVHKSPTTPGALVDGLLATLRSAADERALDLATFLGSVDRIAHGTTAATNAYIERRGATVGLLATHGFEDVIFQQRMMGMTAGLTRSEVTDYSRRAVPEPLCPPWRVHGIRERVDYRGRVLAPLREDDVRAAAEALAAEGVEAVAVCFLWSFKHPDHERRAAELLREALPDAYVTISSEVAPRVGEYERTATTLVNAYLGPRIAQYAATLEDRLAGEGSSARLLLLDSSGGVLAAADAADQPVRLLLSGPAGGLTASEQLAARLGHRNVITLDMGGTSADVGLIVDGAHLTRHESVAQKYHLLVPMADIEAIGAGGGSVARVEGGRYLRVGPESAGADPGPVCYGRGGVEPTVTDADLVLGYLDPSRFLGGRLALDVEAAEHAVRTRVAEPLGLSVLAAAAGIKRIIDSRMADLVRNVTLQRGFDPRTFVLYAFGGAGPTHAPAFGLGLVDEIVVPSTQAVHSALGAAASDLFFSFALAQPVRLGRDAVLAAEEAEGVEAIYRRLEEDALGALARQAVPAVDRRLERFVEMRFTRQTKELRVPVGPEALTPERVRDLGRRFERLYADRYGEESLPSVAGLELVTFVVEARGLLPRPSLPEQPLAGADPAPAELAPRDAFDSAAHEVVETAVYDGALLRPGNVVAGPAIVEYAASTVVLASGQVAVVDALLDLSVRRAA